MEAYPKGQTRRPAARTGRRRSERRGERASTAGEGGLHGGRWLAVMLNSRGDDVASIPVAAGDAASTSTDSASPDHPHRYCLSLSRRACAMLEVGRLAERSGLLLAGRLRGKEAAGSSRSSAAAAAPGFFRFNSQELPKPEDVPGPMLVPSRTGGAPTPCLATPTQLLDAAAPKGHPRKFCSVSSPSPTWLKCYQVRVPPP